MSSGVSLVRVHLFLLSICVLLPQVVRDCLQIIPYKAFSFVHNDVIKNFIASSSSISVAHLCTPPPRLLGTVSKLFYIKHFHWLIMMSTRISLVQVHLFLLSICVLLPQIVRDSLQIILCKAFSLVHNDVIKNFIGSSSSISVVHFCTSTPHC